MAWVLYGVQLAYDLNGNILAENSRTNHADEYRMSYQHDYLNRLTSATEAGAAYTEDYDYSYDSKGNIQRAADTRLKEVTADMVNPEMYDPNPYAGEVWYSDADLVLPGSVVSKYHTYGAEGALAETRSNFGLLSYGSDGIYNGDGTDGEDVFGRSYNRSFLLNDLRGSTRARVELLSDDTNRCGL